MNKKTFTLTCIIALFAAVPVFAQLKLGLKVHPLLSYIRSDTKDFKSYDVTTGFSYGLVVENRFAENYSFYTEFAITHKGGKTIFEYNTSNGRYKREETTYKLQYIEVPFALKLRTDEINNITYYGLFGLAGGVAIRAKQDIKTIDKLTNVATNSNGETFGTNPLSASLLFGGGIEYSLSEKAFITAGVSYNNGFTDIANESRQNRSLDFKISYIALNLGLLF